VQPLKSANAFIELLSLYPDWNVKKETEELLPDDIKVAIHKHTKDPFIELFLSNIINFFNDEKILSKDKSFVWVTHSTYMRSWESFLYTLNYLWRSEFINEEQYRSIFQDFQMVKKITSLMTTELEKKNGIFFFLHLFNLTESIHFSDFYSFTGNRKMSMIP
jgi:hypothetical protein